ncbi:MAG: NAD(P)-dependent glycerol-3-phosphate dehydrogenase [Alphaproteobacteria bacterium]|nr:NAD(P)-dependent glycerol-3-phosphate dehydrogenase [Alphaproteobacteria bacterium]
MRNIEHVGIIGAGAWGTALALTAIRSGLKTTLWAHEPAVVQEIKTHQENSTFLPGIKLDPNICATTDPADILKADAVLAVAPAQFLRPTLSLFEPGWPQGLPIVICAKGIEQGSLALMSEVVTDILPQAPQAVLSGPTFAAEVARGLPTAVTLACRDAKLGARLVQALGTRTFRPYLSDDLIGAEVGGAVKNVLAIACGIVSGKGFGDNARAALITRGLAEIVRLALAKGAKMETLMGLSGLGDLILTANSTQSRNFSVGVALGQGKTLAQALAGKSSVAEGVASAAGTVALGQRMGIELPIAQSVDAVLNQGADLDATIQALLSRPFKSEV